MAVCTINQKHRSNAPINTRITDPIAVQRFSISIRGLPVRSLSCYCIRATALYQSRESQADASPSDWAHTTTEAEPRPAVDGEALTVPKEKFLRFAAFRSANALGKEFRSRGFCKSTATQDRRVLMPSRPLPFSVRSIGPPSRSRRAVSGVPIRFWRFSDPWIPTDIRK
jgi:hypothetical protein